MEATGRLAFATLGMFIIDRIEYLTSDGRSPEDRIIGGAGTYAAIGARLAAGSRFADKVSWIVDMGSDFPPGFKALIESWATSCTFRLDLARLTTTAWNGYGPNEFRAFKYLTPKLRLEEHSLSDEQILARSFHMVCSPARCISLVNGILARRRTLLRGGDATATDEGAYTDNSDDRPIFVWEPVPDLCTPAELDRLREASALVDVVSPNADEFAAFFASMSASCATREAMVAYILSPHEPHADPKPEPTSPALVIREGAQGCTTYLPSSSSLSLHLRAYHQQGDRVRDPTGGGNTFLGALAIGLTGTTTPDDVERVLFSSPPPPPSQGPSSSFVSKQLLLGLLHASVAASYAIEQTGMPALSAADPDVWNDEAYPARFAAYCDREREYIVRQLLQSGAGT